MSQRNLAVIPNETPTALMPSTSEWSLMREMAKSLLPTGFLPNTIKTPEQAVAIMLKGRELNVPPMYALSNIVVVQGKPSCSAELMLALVQREHGLDAMWVEESTNDRCTVSYRAGKGTKSYTFTIKDAEQAGLFKNAVWKSYPAAMLRARCISAVARMAFPGAIGGMYTPGELGDDVTVNHEGEVVSLDTGEIQAHTPQRAQEPRSATVEIVEDDATPTPDPDDWQAASAHLHAVANEHGITHEEIKLWAIAAALKKGRLIESTKEASATALRFMAGQIERDPQKVKDYIDDLKEDAIDAEGADGDDEEAF